jgi:hypothetical protein
MTDQAQATGGGAQVGGMVRAVQDCHPSLVHDLVEGDARTSIIVDMGERHAGLNEERRDKAVIAFVQDPPGAVMEEEPARRRGAGRQRCTMEVKRLLGSRAIAQVIAPWEALAGGRRAGGVPV